MGTQIAFYMTQEDENDFCSFVLSEGDIVILPARTASVPPAPLFPPLAPTSGGFIERGLVLWNKSLFASPEYVQNSTGVYTTAAAQQGGIEFVRSSQEGEVIRAGRLWTEPAYFVGLFGKVAHPTIKKDYDRWIRRLFQWIRSHYVKHSRLFYVGPGACRFQEMGGRLGQMYAEMEDPSKIERRLF